MAVVGAYVRAALTAGVGPSILNATMPVIPATPAGRCFRRGTTKTIQVAFSRRLTVLIRSRQRRCFFGDFELEYEGPGGEAGRPPNVLCTLSPRRWNGVCEANTAGVFEDGQAGGFPRRGNRIKVGGAPTSWLEGWSGALFVITAVLR